MVPRPLKIAFVALIVGVSGAAMWSLYRAAFAPTSSAPGAAVETEDPVAGAPSTAIDLLNRTPANVEPKLADIQPPPAAPPLEARAIITPYPEPHSTAVALTVGENGAEGPADGPTPAASSPPELEALRDIQQLSEKPSTRIGGVVTRSPRLVGGKNASPAVTPNAEEVLDRVGGQARGFMVLPLMHPRARPMVEALINTLLRAQIQQIYLGVLVDGTFSFDLDYLNAVIERLNAGGRELTLVLYVVSGPTMRDYDVTPIRTPFSRLNPTDFRLLIAEDRQTRYFFETAVRRMVPALTLNRSLKPTNRSIVAVMLEDNLDAASYRAMRASAAFVTGSDVEFVRNPCEKCWAGNDGDPQGDGVELHPPASVSKLGRRDGFVMDGRGYFFPGEARGPGEYSIEETFALIDASMARGVGYYGLWRARRQGIINGELPHPDERIYEVPTLEHTEIEIQLLRHGLIPREPVE